MANKGDNLVVLVVGLAIGALAGVLLAPDKGENTRKKIADSTKDLMEDASKKAAELKEEISKKATEIQKDLEKQAEISKTKINKLTENVMAKLKNEKVAANGEAVETGAES
jgi:gas vesicle protein